MMWGGENLKRATEAGDFIEFLIKEMKVLADEIDRFLEVAPDITMIRIVAGISICIVFYSADAALRVTSFPNTVSIPVIMFFSSSIIILISFLYGFLGYSEKKEEILQQRKISFKRLYPEKHEF